MQPIVPHEVQAALSRFLNTDLYLHLETTNGAYAAHHGPADAMAVCAYIRNGKIKYTRGTITGEGPYRVGLKMAEGWVYAEGLTDFEIDSLGRLLLAGHNRDGRMAVALELSETPFEV